ncbi:hypothetical protein [Salinisphaera hydrothermalis]|uniref:hypothetical protein n=1 Tax=Salinisphaera hydrothermalis TaxID=563188 RepID=UPI00333E66EC
MTAAGTITFFAINRLPDDAVSLDIDLQGFGSSRLLEHRRLSHTDPKAANIEGQPDGVAPVDGHGLACDHGRLTGRLDPLTYRFIRIAVDIARI